MKRYLTFAILFFGTLITAPTARAGQIVDRIVATVNGQIILQSDWQDAIRYQALVDNRQLGQITLQERKAALDHLIDQELLKEQIGAADFQHASEQAIAQQIADIRKQYPGADAPQQWNKVLQQYGFTEDVLRRCVASQIDLTRVVDEHLRPNVNIDSRSIESYYNQELLPQLRQSGAAEVPLADVTPKIKELLTQQKVNELLVAWLQTLRSGSEIRTEPGTSAGEDLR